MVAAGGTSACCLLQLLPAVSKGQQRRLEGAEALVGSVWTLALCRLTWPAVVACASWRFWGRCMRLWMILARRSGATSTPYCACGRRRRTLSL
jgi:hypothetical protein